MLFFYFFSTHIQEHTAFTQTTHTHPLISSSLINHGHAPPAAARFLYHTRSLLSPCGRLNSLGTASNATCCLWIGRPYNKMVS